MTRTATVAGVVFVALRLAVAIAVADVVNPPYTNIFLYKEDDDVGVKLKGDIILGGLFPVHEDASATGSHCGAVKPDKGVQRLEAMVFALKMINQGANILLPNITLGAHILDTCNQDTHALEQTLKFIKNSLSQNNMEFYHCPNNQTIINRAPLPVTAVIGAASSQVSSMVANVLRLFEIPQISYSSTSKELSDKSRFQYFSRVVPPDDLQAQAMVDVVDKLNWSYVSVVFDDGSYGEQGIEAFVKHASEKEICIGSRHKLKRDFKEEDFQNVVIELNKQTHNGVIMFANEDNVKRILKAASDLSKFKKEKQIAWVASDNWGTKRTAVQDHPHSAFGAITIQPKMKKVPAFDEYFKYLHPSNATYKWFQEFWMHEFNCSTLDDSCLNNTLAKSHQQEVYVPFVIDAVYLAAHSIHALLKHLCTGQPFQICIKHLRIEGPTLLEYIRRTKFTGMQDEEVRLNENGDRMIRYDIYQFREIEKQYVIVGEWGSNELKLNVSLLRTGYVDQAVPKSTCGRDCAVNEYKWRTHVSCCWQCILCNDSSVMPNNTSCKPCDEGFLPNSHKNECVPMVPELLHWTSPYAVVPACFSAVGLTATLFVVQVFVRHNGTPVIMASGRELCYIMLCGIGLCYAMTFVLLNRPTAIICGLIRLGLGLCLCVIYSAILTKTSRLSRIFTSNVEAMRRPRFISPRAQLAICGVLILVQITGGLLWVTVDPPSVKALYPDRNTQILSCAVTAQPLLFSFIYIAILIILCTVYAFKTRKIPENFNETQHIGFTMYATCVIWLAFIPIYFGTNNNFRVQNTSLCMCLSLSGTVALCCFFAPKVYIVLFQPAKNIRGHTSSKGFQKMQMGVVNQQMRFLNRPSTCDPATNATQVSYNADTLANTTSMNSMKSIDSINDEGTSEEQRSASFSIPHASTESKLNVVKGGANSKNHFVRHSISTPTQINAQHRIEKRSTGGVRLAVPNETTNFLTVSNSSTPLIQPKLIITDNNNIFHGDDQSPVCKRRNDRLDWILVDPQKEFEAILSKISDQRGTFV